MITLIQIKLENDNCIYLKVPSIEELQYAKNMGIKIEIDIF